MLTWPGHDPYPLPESAPIHLTEAARAMLTDASTIAPPAADATLSAGTLTTLLPHTVLRLRRGCMGILPGGRQRLTQQTPAQLNADTSARLPAGTRVMLWAGGWQTPHEGEATPARLPADTEVTLRSDTWVRLSDARSAQLAPDTRVALPAGAAVTFPQAAPPPILADRRVTFPDGARATLSQAVGELPAGTEVRIAAAADATLRADASAPLADVSQGPKAEIRAPAGAGIKVLGGAIIGEVTDTIGQFPARVKMGQTIQVPLGSRIVILAGQIIALPGGSVMAVKGKSAFAIVNDGSGLMVIASDAQEDPSADDKSHHGKDITLELPVFVTVAAGAEITAAGVADVMLPERTEVNGCAPAPTAPGWPSFRVARVVRAGQAGAGRTQSRCQPARKASAHGQSGLIARVRCRAWRASRAGRCQTR